MRIELTLCGGASMIGQTLKADRPLMAIDLQDETIQSTLVKQFAEMIHDIIKGQANERKVRGGKDAILEEMALEFIEAGINPLELAERVYKECKQKISEWQEKE